MERVAIPLSRGSSQPRSQIWVSYIAGRVFMSEPLRKPTSYLSKRKLYRNDLGTSRRGRKVMFFSYCPTVSSIPASF